MLHRKSNSVCGTCLSGHLKHKEKFIINRYTAGLTWFVKHCRLLFVFTLQCIITYGRQVRLVFIIKRSLGNIIFIEEFSLSGRKFSQNINIDVGAVIHNFCIVLVAHVKSTYKTQHHGQLIQIMKDFMNNEKQFQCLKLHFWPTDIIQV